MAQVLGVEVPDPPETFTPMEVTVIAKGFESDDGSASLIRLSSEGIGDIELLGQYMACALMMGRAILKDTR